MLLIVVIEVILLLVSVYRITGCLQCTRNWLVLKCCMSSTAWRVGAISGHMHTVLNHCKNALN